MSNAKLTNLNLTPKSGLKPAEVDARLEQFGINELIASRQPPLWRKIWQHLSDVSSLVLLFAVGLASYMAIAQNGGWMKTIVIGSILVINVAIGLYQEASAEKALAALKSMSLPTTTVRRDNVTQTIAAIPGLRNLIGLVALPASGWVIAIVGMFVPTIVLELNKRWNRRRQGIVADPDLAE